MSPLLHYLPCSSDAHAPSRACGSGAAPAADPSQAQLFSTACTQGKLQPRQAGSSAGEQQAPSSSPQHPDPTYGRETNPLHCSERTDWLSRHKGPPGPARRGSRAQPSHAQPRRPPPQRAYPRFLQGVSSQLHQRSHSLPEGTALRLLPDRGQRVHASAGRATVQLLKAAVNLKVLGWSLADIYVSHSHQSHTQPSPGDSRDATGQGTMPGQVPGSWVFCLSHPIPQAPVGLSTTAPYLLSILPECPEHPPVMDLLCKSFL